MERQLPKIYSNFLEYNPLSNVDFTEEYTREITGTNNGNDTQKSTNNMNSSGNSNSSSNSNTSGLSVNSDTPQGQINKSDILNGKYASNTGAQESESQIQDNTSTSQNSDSTSSLNITSSQNSNTIEKFTRHEEGDNGVIITNQRLVKEYREIIVAIDEEIIFELNKLFMGLY